MNMRILQTTDRELVMAYGKKHLAENKNDPMELEMATWTAPWRSESLDHYLKLGWCFAATDKGDQDLIGVALAQPFLFYKGQTQSIWVEYLEADNHEAKKALIETLYKWSRDKHIQKLIVGGDCALDLLGLPWPLIQRQGDWQIPTTRSRE